MGPGHFFWSFCCETFTGCSLGNWLGSWVVAFFPKKTFWTNLLRYTLHTLLAGPIKFDQYTTKKQHAVASFYMWKKNNWASSCGFKPSSITSPKITAIFTIALRFCFETSNSYQNFSQSECTKLPNIRNLHPKKNKNSNRPDGVKNIWANQSNCTMRLILP